MAVRSTHAFRQMPPADGFTLIELMIVVAVVAILAAIAYPSYMDSVIKSRRTAATTCLMEAAGYMERLYTTKLTYVGAALPVHACATELAPHYTFAINGTPTAAAYSVQATPIGQQLAKDTKCGVLGLDQKGTRSEAGTGTVSECW